MDEAQMGNKPSANPKMKAYVKWDTLCEQRKKAAGNLAQTTGSIGKFMLIIGILIGVLGFIISFCVWIVAGMIYCPIIGVALAILSLPFFVAAEMIEQLSMISITANEMRKQVADMRAEMCEGLVVLAENTARQRRWGTYDENGGAP